MPSRPKEYEIHISDINEYRRCRQAWHWSSPLRSNLVPVERYAPFFLGELVHHALEYHYRFRSNPLDAINLFLEASTGWEKSYRTVLTSLPPKLYEAYTLAITIADHYLIWQKYDQSWLADREFEFVAPEQDFSRVISSNTRKRIIHAGRFDGIVYHRAEGKYYLWELKTTRSLIEREKQLALDMQTDTYMLAAKDILARLGQSIDGVIYPIEGIIYTLMRKKEPTTPEVLKSGYLSTKANIDTTPEWYMETAKKHHSDLDTNARKQIIDRQYADIIQTLLGQPNKYFSRILVKRSQAQLDNTQQDLAAISKEMIDPKTPIYITDGPHCNYCLFRAPCIAKRNGKVLEANTMLRDLYQQRTPRTDLSDGYTFGANYE